MFCKQIHYTGKYHINLCFYVAIEDDKHISIVIAFFDNIYEFSINYKSNDVENVHLDIY